MSGDTASDLSVSRARDWLKTCLTQHTSCKNESFWWAPTRLLDLTDLSLETGASPTQAHSGVVKLVHTSSLRYLSYPEYACLSHCWGKERLITTTKENLREAAHGIPVELFPKTFQHAIITTLKLGTSYLWIDSLCIVQDSAEDWDKESKEMARVYSSALFTIAASRARGAADGCFSKPDARFRGEQITAYRRDGSTFPVWVRHRIKHKSWPLLERGWVFQERLLSRRIIHFSDEELVWECREHSTCECTRVVSSWPQLNILDKKSQHHVSMGSNSPADMADQWRSMIGTYTRMALSFEKDIFPALSGLAKTFQPFRSTYFAGLWRDSILMDLL